MMKCESWVNGETGHMIKRQDHKRRSLHHKEVGYPSAPNQVVGGARTRDIIGRWWQLFKGGFNEHSTQR